VRHEGFEPCVPADGLQQRRQGFLVHPPIGVEQRPQPCLLGQPGDVEHVLVKDRRLVVGERDGVAPFGLGQFNRPLGGDGIVSYLLKASL
jgi:hypothetical protein